MTNSPSTPRRRASAGSTFNAGVGSSTKTRTPTLACAIYTRKSSEDGLEQSFNSLDAQREACAAYVLSQKSLGWSASPVLYDDGGYSGGNTDRPALRQLLADVTAKRIKVIVVYKVDRLTRSLADFAKLVELFDAHGVSFVSVTQQFNTTTSMGRLTLNVLLSFAQFEREVTAERIRDKIAASKRRGMWMGGLPPMGYVAREKALCIDEEQALRVREIFKLYLDLGCVRAVQTELNQRGWVTPARSTKRAGAAGERPFSRGHLYRMLSNPIYAGQVAHKDSVYEGNHMRLISAEIWHAVQERLAANLNGNRNRVNAKDPSLLAGLVWDEAGDRMTPTHAQKGQRRYRYYVSRSRHVGTAQDGSNPGWRIPAQELEQAVLLGLKQFLTDESRLLDWMENQTNEEEKCRCTSAEVKETLRCARDKALELQSSPLATLAEVVDRVLVKADQIEIGLKRQVLDDVDEESAGGGESIWITIPVELKRGGMAMRLVVKGPQMEKRSPDMKLLGLLARAHEWFRRLKTGDADGVAMIAREEEVSAGYVSRVINLAFLAPDIVQTIANGEQPIQLTADKLMRMVPLPSDWEAQKALLGMSDS